MGDKKQLVGQYFLHTHPFTEKRLGLTEEHVIVDKKEWDIVIDFFNTNPDQIKELVKGGSKLLSEYDDRTNPFINAARGRDYNGINNDEVSIINKKRGL